MTMSPATTGRRSRADGEATRQAILSSAAALATVQGLDRLSIGGLAEHIGISKSGLFAHFRSKESLQLATIAYAWDVFDREVVDRALQTPAGLDRVLALTDEYLAHLERGVFPGGCFFAATSAELHLQPGVINERLEDFGHYWLGLIRSNLEVARAAGDLARDTDLDQLTFEIESHVFHAHLVFPIRGDRDALERAARAIRGTLGMGPGTVHRRPADQATSG